MFFDDRGGKKGRLTTRSPGHHTYHIFRLLCNGAPPALRSQLGLKSLKAYSMVASEARNSDPAADAVYFDECCESYVLFSLLSSFFQAIVCLSSTS